jgi:hypothetical protein
MLSDEEIREESAWQWAKPLVERIKECLKKYGYTLEREVNREKSHCLFRVRGRDISCCKDYELGNFYGMLLALFCCVISIQCQLLYQFLRAERDYIVSGNSDQGEVQIAWGLRLPNSVYYHMSLEFRADLQCPCPNTITAKLRIKDLTLGILNLDEQYPLTEIPQIIVDLPRLWALSRL